MYQQTNDKENRILLPFIHYEIFYFLIHKKPGTHSHLIEKKNPLMIKNTYFVLQSS